MERSIRRSARTKKVPTSYSPPPAEILSVVRKGRKKARSGQNVKKSEEKDYSCDMTPDGQPFTCDMCGTPYVIDPYKRKKTGITKRMLPRQRLDPATGQHLMLCNACGIAKMRQIKTNHRPRIKSMATDEEKELYTKEAKSFADSLVTNLDDVTAEKLYCPRFTSKPCRCIQTYITNADDNDGYRQRAVYLIKLIRLAQKYSSLKSYDINDVIGPGGKRNKLGIGRGHKKSKVYEDFVLTRRTQLKSQCNLCEVAIKKVLCYSNNFLFKKLKSQESECRVEKVKGRGKKSANLIPVNKLAQEKCCHGKCTVMALSHVNLLQEWRDRAGKGQSEARRVIAEMLTPSGLHTNCYAFIRMVTGVTRSVISSVNSYMRETGGRRDPPPHGLKTFWENHPKRRKLDNKTDNIVSLQDGGIMSVMESESSLVRNQRKVLLATSNDDEDDEDGDNAQDDIAVVADSDIQDKTICLSPSVEQLTSNHNTAASIMVLDSSGTLNNPDDHLELIPFCNPDGSTQLIQVPIIAYSNPEGDSLLQDLNLQIPVDPGGLVLDNGSAFLDNNGIILDIPTLPHSLLQNPATIKSQVNPESQASSIRTVPIEVNTAKDSTLSSDAQQRDQYLITTAQNNTDIYSKGESKTENTESQLVLRNRSNEVRDTVQMLPPHSAMSNITEMKRLDIPVSGDRDELSATVLSISDCQLADFSISKDSSATAIKNPYSVNTSQPTSADVIYKIETASSNDLPGSISDADMALQGEMLYMDSNKLLPLTSIHGTSSLLYPPNAEVLSTRNFENLSTSGVRTSQYLISSISSPGESSSVSSVKTKSPTINYVPTQSQQKPSVPSQQTAGTEGSHLESSVVTCVKDSKTYANCTLLLPEQMPPITCSTKLERKGIQSIERSVFDMMTSAESMKDTLWQPSTVSSLCVTKQSSVINSSSSQNIPPTLLLEQSYAQPVLTSTKSLNVPVKCTSVEASSSMALPATTKSHLAATTFVQPVKTLSSTLLRDKQPVGLTKPGMIRKSKRTNFGVQLGSTTQLSILPKPAPGGILASHSSSNASLPMTVLAVSTAAPSQIVISTGLVPSTVPGLMFSSLVNPMPQIVMPIVNNKSIESQHTNPVSAVQNAAPMQGLQFGSSSTIILHNATSQRGGSFSLQHLANQKTGSVAVEHGQGSMYITRAPNSDIQFVQPIMPRLLLPPVEQMKSVHQVASSIMTVPVRQAPAPIATDQHLLQTITTVLPTATSSSKRHLKEMLPVLPTTVFANKHKS